jgi:hypothetical protein
MRSFLIKYFFFGDDVLENYFPAELIKSFFVDLGADNADKVT